MFKAGDAFGFKLDEQLHPVDARIGDLLQQLRRLVNVAQQGFFGAAVRLEGGVGRGRDSVDGVAANQQFDVAHVGVGRVFGAGACPQEALYGRAFFGKVCPVVVADALQVVAVGGLCVGDGGATA